MIQRPLREINEKDLLLLIENKIPEKKTIEYKSKLPGLLGDDKKEFLYDVSSFANTSGGDLVYGIEEQGGVPVAIPGIHVADLDAEKRRLENLIRDGIDPRIRYDIADIVCSSGTVIVFRIEQSWVRPHRVILSGSDKFYGRNATGKYPLDVGELRVAFTGSETLAERVRAFRVDRVIAIANNETPVPFISGAKIILHFIPLESFGGGKQVNFLEFYTNFARWLPSNGTWDRRINLDGALLINQWEHGNCCSYQLVYRNGILEIVDGLTLKQWNESSSEVPTIPNPGCEAFVLSQFRDGIKKLLHLGVSAPIVVAVTLTGVKGFRMALHGLMPVFFKRDVIDKNMLLLPEIIVDDLNTLPEKALKPLFDMLSNACGFPESRNFNPDGSWKHGPY